MQWEVIVSVIFAVCVVAILAVCVVAIFAVCVVAVVQSSSSQTPLQWTPERVSEAPVRRQSMPVRPLQSSSSQTSLQWTPERVSEAPAQGSGAQISPEEQVRRDQLLQRFSREFPVHKRRSAVEKERDRELWRAQSEQMHLINSLSLDASSELHLAVRVPSSFQVERAWRPR